MLEDCRTRTSPDRELVSACETGTRHGIDVNYIAAVEMRARLPAESAYCPRVEAEQI